MFDFVRKHTRVMQLVLFLLIVPSFVLFGLEGYSQMQEKGEAVARVDGREITSSELDAAHKEQMDRLRQDVPQLDPKIFDTPEARYNTLERMVRERVLDAAARDSKLTASDQRLARELQGNQMIAMLRGPDGKLDMARYRDMLTRQGMTPELFENTVRAELSVRQVLGGMAGSAIAGPVAASAGLNPFFEKRELQVAAFAPAAYTAKVTVTDAEVEAYYKANPARFQAPEQANIEYVLLDLDTVAKGLTVNEQDLKTYYEQNIARTAAAEERRASHILIASAKTDPADKRAAAKARAEQLAAEAKKAPEAFAELARKNSQHQETAAKGGDLDFFTRASMPPTFSDAAFAMKKGDIAGPVETDLGFHVIRLTDIKTAATPPTFEQARPGLELQLKRQQAQRKYAEAAEVFSNTVYEQADTLKGVADKLKLEVLSAKGLTREPVPGSPLPLTNPKFLNAIFSPDAVEKKRNTEAMEVAPSQMISGRIVQYTPARTRPLAEVKDEARAALVAQRAADLARKEGQERLAAWKAAPASAALPVTAVVSRQDAQKQPQAVVDAALRVDGSALPQFVGVDLGADGYAVVKVNKLLPRTPPTPEAQKQEVAQYTKWWATAEGEAYYQLLKDRFKAEIKLPKPAPEPASGKPAATVNVR